MINIKRSLGSEPYHIINLSFAGIILLIFIYSGIFSAEKNNYPIKSACEILTGQPYKARMRLSRTIIIKGFFLFLYPTDYEIYYFVPNPDF